MHLRNRLAVRWIVPAMFLLATQLMAAPEKATPIVIVADSRRFTGLRAWWANLYNESHFYFALTTVVLVPLTGMILGILADRVMSLIGIDLKSRTLKEG